MLIEAGGRDIGNLARLHLDDHALLLLDALAGLADGEVVLDREGHGGLEVQGFRHRLLRSGSAAERGADEDGGGREGGRQTEGKQRT